VNEKFLALKGTFMGNIVPYNKEDPELWKQQNEAAIQKIHDESLIMIINGVLNLHELEQTGEWRHSRRRLDYSKLTFEMYLQHHTTWSLTEFGLLEEAIFDHLDELKRLGLGAVLQLLKKDKPKTKLK
jgi:hypothetical protein